jgi:hypothetical protein
MFARLYLEGTHISPNQEHGLQANGLRADIWPNSIDASFAAIGAPPA